MRIEHFAYQVEHTAKASSWYCQHLGFVVKRSADDPVPVRFLADESGCVMIEIYNNPTVTTPDYASMDPLLLHLAFVCDHVQTATDRLLEAGATWVSGPEIMGNGDEIAMLRDPWGLAIQFIRRTDPMV
jgi:glyoxylase I family protein